MSETQRRVTATFEALDESGKQYHVVEYTIFRHTTTTDISYGDGSGDAKEYELTNGAPLKRISETHFETAADGVKISRKS